LRNSAICELSVFQKSGIHSFLQIMRDQRGSSFLLEQIDPAFFEQPTPFPHISFVHCTVPIHFSKLSMNFRVKKICSISKSYHRLHFTSNRFLDFVFICNDYS
jgi:hypothetical protein